MGKEGRVGWGKSAIISTLKIFNNKKIVITEMPGDKIVSKIP